MEKERILGSFSIDGTPDDDLIMQFFFSSVLLIDRIFRCIFEWNTQIGYLIGTQPTTNGRKAFGIFEYYQTIAILFRRQPILLLWQSMSISLYLYVEQKPYA